MQMGQLLSRTFRLPLSNVMTQHIQLPYRKSSNKSFRVLVLHPKVFAEYPKFVSYKKLVTI
jgi:hypothetical protein